MYDPVMAPMDRLGLKRWREWATAIARGRVLEIGVGSGLNFPRYPRAASGIFAFDPDAEMVEMARERADRRRVFLQIARGEEIPFGDETFDAAVGTLVFCMVANPARALAELRRVLKPNAPLRLVEHVRHGHPWIAGVQDFLTPAWEHFSGGCHLNRDTLREIERAGFEIRAVEKRFGGLLIGVEAVNSGV
jgi:ubiquinone/menaquinone biosynthesis C-methylase UbiE